MRARKHLTAGQRFANLGGGLVGITFAVVIAQQGESGWGGVIAFVVGAFALGGIFRGIAGYDEV